MTSSQTGNVSGKSVYDAIVIGAGHNGLAAAAYLARWGYARWSWSAGRSLEAIV